MELNVFGVRDETGRLLYSIIMGSPSQAHQVLRTSCLTMMKLPLPKWGARFWGELGYSVTTRTSSVKALALFRENPQAFELIVTHMTMPIMTGDQLAVELMKVRSDIPVVLCTGYSKKLSEKTALEIGIKAFAHKPIGKYDLAKTIRNVLDETDRS